MNCTGCGNPLPPGAQACPYCGTPLNPYGQPNGQNVYQQSYVQYQPGQYPTGYQTPYGYGQEPVREPYGVLHALSGLPRAFVESFSNPGEVLRSMVERRDWLSGPIVAALVLVMAALSGLVIMRGFVDVLLSMAAAFTGSGMTGASQSAAYIAGRIAPSVGGIVALCQLISMLVPTAVFMVYICMICHVAFSWELALGFLAVTSLGTVAVSLMAMALSLLSPWLALAVMICGMAISYTQACGMLGLITARADVQLMRAKLILTCLSILLTLALNGLAGGLLMSGVMQRVMGLLHSVGSLI